MSSKKVEEGYALIRNAEKNLKTSLLKWRPDYDLAADDYTKAATAFRLAKSYDKSEECLLKAIECHKNNRSWFHAAKCYEQVVIISKECNNFSKIEEYANKACSLYQQHGSPEAAASALDKAAKIIEQTQPEVALRFYGNALEIAVGEDSIRRAAEYASKVSRILVKLKLYDQAADAVRREIGFNQQTEMYGQLGRLAVALVLVQLGRGDFVAAEKAFKEWGNCCDPQEMETLETLLQAFDDEDPKTAAKALSSPFIRHMDVEYSILAREISLPEEIKVSATTASEANVTASTSRSSEHHFKDEDAEEDGLC